MQRRTKAQAQAKEKANAQEAKALLLRFGPFLSLRRSRQKATVHLKI